ncbi:hypothetical protein QL982_14510, partial [Psychrobacter sp. 5A.1]|uniref:hypothetical protein n=1 Tax=Psychrobacter sp. 5A.1 TaxID=3035207 RepID=UPI0025B52DB7
YLHYFPCLTAIYLIFITIFKMRTRPNKKDKYNGLTTIKLNTDDKGKLKGETIVKNQSLLEEKTFLQRQYIQRIQSASGVVVVTYTDKDEVSNEYAIVGDDFRVNDAPFWNFDDGFGAGKQFGGKLGIVKDPFNKKEGPVFLGGTTPITVPPGMIWDLECSGQLI